MKTPNTEKTNKTSTNKISLLYIFTIIFFICLSIFVLEKGKNLESNYILKQISINNSAKPIPVPDAEQIPKIEKNSVGGNTNEESKTNIFFDAVKNNLKSPLGILILQIIIIIVFARMFGYLFLKIGQAAVTGEIVSGIVLGPSLISGIFPEFKNFVFPTNSLNNLQILSQVGLILFMFIIGMELNMKALKAKASKAIFISHTSMSFSFFVGTCLAYLLYNNFAADQTSFLNFGLFIGVSLSITAFPVLARIIQERNLTQTPIGSMVLTCAAIDDITAWCVLAGIIAIIKAGNIGNIFVVIFMAVMYILLMLKVIQPLIRRLEVKHKYFENINKKTISILFITMLGSSYLTELIGIHPLFGAFLAGVIMPENINSRKALIEKIEDVSLVLLLPLFFVFVGLKTQIGLVTDTKDIFVCLLIISMAFLGKFIGCTSAAKVVGNNWRGALSIGALMNTKGLMELIVLNIGYELGIFSGKVFTMMVIMAIVITLMTTPMLNFIETKIRSDAPELES